MESRMGRISLAGTQNKKLRTSDVYFVQPSFFDIFDFPWLSGTPDGALKDPNTVALTRTIANNWFGNWQDAVGKTILVGLDRVPYKVTGIMEDAPSNTDLQLKVLLSYITFRNNNQSAFSDPGNYDNFNPSSQCFFLLGKNQNIGSMEKLLPGFIKRHYEPLAATSNTSNSSLFQPLKEMHFDARFYRLSANGLSYDELLTMGLIGIFILLMACVNFINLSTAQSLNRGKEIGIKKVLGSNAPRLFTDYLTETGILVFMALLAGLSIAILGWPTITQILGKSIPLISFASIAAAAFLIFVGVSVTFLAGFYPAMILSRFKPILALKGKGQSTGGGNMFVRRGLITFQFVISQMLIIGTLVVTSQMTFFRHRPMGFDRNAIVLLHLPYTSDGLVRNELFKQQVARTKGVLSATLCSQPPSTNKSGSTYFTFDNHTHPENLKIAYRSADSNYLSTFNIKLASGRYPRESDTISEAMLNETTVKLLGLKSPEDVLGKFMLWSSNQSIPIVGVVKDFQAGSLKEKIQPIALFSARQNYGTLAVKMDPSSLMATIPKLEAMFSTAFPDKFFEAPFFDEKIAAYYNSEAVALKLFKIFAVLGIFISCLGLYGLVSFMTFQKNKEVGIRKVLGASSRSVVLLFSSEFTVLIIVSFLISAPISYYFMDRWLSTFYYHTNISWTVFAITLILSILIAWFTVGYKAVKAAIANPVKSLRSE